MKGISRFITYSFTILLGFIILTVFTTLIYGYYDQVSKSNIRSSLKQICVQTFFGIVNLYNRGMENDLIPDNSTAAVIHKIDLNYPDSISGKEFEVYLISSSEIWNTIKNITIDGKIVNIKEEINSGSKIIANTIDKPSVSFEYNLPNMPVIIQGKFSSGDNQTLSLIRYNNNGTIEHVVILGNSDLFIRLNTIN